MTILQGALQAEARDALVYAGSNLLNRLGALLLLPVYLHFLSPADYGVIAVIGAIGAFQAIFSSLCLDLAVTRFFYEWPDSERRRILGVIWTWSWLATVATFIISVALLPLLLAQVFPTVGPELFALGLLGNALQGLFIIPASTIRIQRLPRRYVACNLVGFAVGATLGIWLVAGVGLGLAGYLAAFIGSNLAVAALGAEAMARASRAGLESPARREAFAFALRAIPAQLIGAAGGAADRLLLGFLADLRTLGIYAVALRFAEVISALHTSLKMSFGPFMMRAIAGGQSGPKIVASMTPYYLIPYFVLSVAIALLVDPLLALLRVESFAGVGGVVPWLVAASLLSVLSFYYCNGLFLGLRTELLTVPAAMQVVVLIAANLVLVPRFQVDGVIASRILSVGLFLGVSYYLSQRAFPMPHAPLPLVGMAAGATLTVFLGLGVTAQEIAVDVTWRLGLVVAYAAFATGVTRVVTRESGSTPLAGSA